MPITESVITHNVGYKDSGHAPDRAEDWAYGTPEPWGRAQAGREASARGLPVAFEPGSGPEAIATAEREGYADHMVYAAGNVGASHLFVQSGWVPLIGPQAWRVITETFGTDASTSPAAWLVFRDAECYRQSWGSGWEISCAPGPYAHLISLRYAEQPVRYCIPSIATAVARQTPAAGLTPQPCQRALAAPVARESRNVLYWPAGAVVGLDLDDAWRTVSYHVSLTFLDSGTDVLVLAAGNEEVVIAKADTGQWRTVEIDLSASAPNQMAYGTDIEVRTANGGEWLHSIYVSRTSSPLPTLPPTPPPTRPVSPTPTATPTPPAQAAAAGRPAGLVVVRDSGRPTPDARIAGSNAQKPWREIQYCATCVIDWSTTLRRAAEVYAAGYQLWVTVDLITSNPDTRQRDYLHLPYGVPTVTYNDGCIPDNVAPDYASLEFRRLYAAMVASAIATLDARPEIAGYIVSVGVDQETIPVKPRCGRAGLTNFEKVVPCSAYQDFTRFAAQQWSAARKPAYVSVLARCSMEDHRLARRDMITYLSTLP